MDAPTTKTEFRQRYARGEFGNRPASWPTFHALVDSGYRGNVTVRSSKPGGPCAYNVPHTDAWKYDADCYFNESMPDEDLLIQGEVYRDVGGLNLAYSTTAGAAMRDAMQSPKTAVGLVATMILKRYLWPASYDDLEQLLDDYDGIVEFGAYQYGVGSCPHRNTVFWEVRNY